MSEKSSFHTQAEKGVKATIKHGGEIPGEFVGREPNARVAEVMAYAAKPLVESALSDMQNEPNILNTLEINGEVGLNDAPGTVSAYGSKRYYRDMANDVNRGYQAANEVQESYYSQVADAQKVLEEAQNNL